MSNPVPSFSLVMASFNNGHLLPCAVESVLKQIEPCWELLIIDDCSVDESLSTAQRFALHDERIRVLANDRNRGVGFTKRRGVAESRGALVGIVDPDDALTPDALAVMIEAHERVPEVSLCWSEHLICDEELMPQKSSNSEFRGDKEMGYLTARPGDIHHFWVFKREAYDRTAGFSDQLRFAEDQDLFYKLEEVGHTKNVPHALYHYRHHGGAISLGRNTACAFALHLEVMFAALARRRRIARSADWASQRDVVYDHYQRFCNWGMPHIGESRALRLVWKASHVFGLSALGVAMCRTLPGRLLKKIRSSP